MLHPVESFGKQTYILTFSHIYYPLGIVLTVVLMAALLLNKPDHLESDGPRWDYPFNPGGGQKQGERP